MDRRPGHPCRRRRAPVALRTSPAHHRHHARDRRALAVQPAARPLPRRVPEPTRVHRQPLARRVSTDRGTPDGHRPRRVLRGLLLVAHARHVRDRPRERERDARPRRDHRDREEPAVGPQAHASDRRRPHPGGRLRRRLVRSGSYARRVADTTSTPAGTRAERRDRATADTRARILEAARDCLLAEGFANLSTRRVAEAAEVPLSQIHYHFGSKQALILALLEAENDRLLARQRAMFGGPEPLWQQWDRACDYLDEDIDSGYVRILQEMIAAGWSDKEVAAAVREYMAGWFRLLTEVAEREGHRLGGLGPFTAAEIGTLMGIPFMGGESMILVGFSDETLPVRSALRRIGDVIRALEERAS